MSKPKRIQRKRTKGFRMPNAIYVGRPSPWGNPYTMGQYNASTAKHMFHQWAWSRALADPDWLKPLHGKDLACWCRLGDPCHADVLLELANPDPS